MFKIDKIVIPSIFKCTHTVTAILRHAQQHNDYNSLDVVGLLVLFPVFIQLMNLARNVALLLQVKSLKEDKYTKLHLCTR